MEVIRLTDGSSVIDNRTDDEIQADCVHPESGCGCEETTEMKLDLKGEKWVYTNFRDDVYEENQGWVRQSDGYFPVVVCDGGHYETDYDGVGYTSDWKIDIQTNEKCPFCDRRLRAEMEDETAEGNYAVYSVCYGYSKKECDFVSPTHFVECDEREYEDYGDTYVPYGDMWVKL